MIPSTRACISIEASQDRRKIVSAVLSRLSTGLSMSSAEDSKNEIKVLSAQISGVLRNALESEVKKIQVHIEKLTNLR